MKCLPTCIRRTPCRNRGAVAEGATLEREAQDQFYGKRSGCLRDPFGHRWNIGHNIEDVSPEEMQRRYAEALKQ